MQTQAQERTSMYAHDIEIGKGASQWVINLRASVRPAMVTYYVHHVNVCRTVQSGLHGPSGSAFDVVR
jgi:hypothetical protein